MAPNSDFKGTPVLDVEYVRNGTEAQLQCNTIYYYLMVLFPIILIDP